MLAIRCDGHKPFAISKFPSRVLYVSLLSEKVFVLGALF